MPLRFAETTQEAYHLPLTIGHLLDAAMISAADQEIVYRDKVRLTYREMRARVGRLAHVLHDLGVEQGTTVAVMDWDSHRYLEACFAIPMMGAVLQTVNVRLPAAQVAFTLHDAAAQVILCHKDFLPLLEAVLPQLPACRAVLLLTDEPATALPDGVVGEYEAMLAQADSADFPFEDFDEDAIATTFYTSGTTGNPKGVEFTHRQIVLLSLASKAPFGVGDTPGFGVYDVYMPLTPMFHVHAWCVPYIATMMGVKQVYPGRYEPEMICRLRAAEQVSYSHCVPTVLQMVVGEAQRTGANLSGWTLTIGGSALTHALWKLATSLGMHIHYARRIVTKSDADALTAAGLPLPLVSYRVVDSDMRDMPHDGTSAGKLVVRAPWLTQSYLGNAEASQALWRGGWLHTQDVATIAPDGTLTICDRLKDVIKTGGEWISSVEIEDMLAAVKGVAEVAVIGVPDDRWGERPLAIVVPAPGAQLELTDLNAALDAPIAAGTLTRYARLDRFMLVEALPRTSVGKIDKKVIRTLIDAAPSCVADPMPSPTTIAAA